MTNYFITGTDTDAGKTLVTASCLYGLNQSGIKTVGIKPIAAGAELQHGHWVNSDAQALAQYSAGELSASDINPICFEPPIAPHIAAARANQPINPEVIYQRIAEIQQQVKPEITLIEGAGGWKVPLDLSGATFADLPKKQRWPVIMVVGMKLGCLNHALLTADAMISDGLGLVGWVANCIDPDMSELEANIESLRSLLAMPCIGVVPHLEHATPQHVWPYLKQGTIDLVKRYQAKGW